MSSTAALPRLFAAIEAEKGGMAARKVLTYDGRDGKTDYVLKSEPLLFDEAVG